MGLALRVKPPPIILASQLNTGLCPSPSCSIFNYFSANTPWKAAEEGPATYLGYPDEMLGGVQSPLLALVSAGLGRKQW